MCPISLSEAVATAVSAHYRHTRHGSLNKAPCGIRTHDLPLTERVLCQLS